MNSTATGEEVSAPKDSPSIKVEDGEWKSPIVKFFSEDEKGGAATTSSQIEEGDLVLFAADKWDDRLRSARPAASADRRDSAPDERRAARFSLGNRFSAAFNATPRPSKWSAMHHPFTRPKAEDLPLLEEEALRRGARRRPTTWCLNGRRDRRRQHPDPRTRFAGENVRGARPNERRRQTSNSAICCAPSVSARRRTAASPSASIASSCSSAAQNRSAT